jgi:hypothetical protein
MRLKRWPRPISPFGNNATKKIIVNPNVNCQRVASAPKIASDE